MTMLTTIPLLAFLLLLTSLLLLAACWFYWLSCRCWHGHFCYDLLCSCRRRPICCWPACCCYYPCWDAYPAVAGFLVNAVAVCWCCPFRFWHACCCWLSACCWYPAIGAHAAVCVPAVAGSGCVSTAAVVGFSIVAAPLLVTTPPPHFGLYFCQYLEHNN